MGGKRHDDCRFRARYRHGDGSVAAEIARQAGGRPSRRPHDAAGGAGRLRGRARQAMGPGGAVAPGLRPLAAARPLATGRRADAAVRRHQGHVRAPPGAAHGHTRPGRGRQERPRHQTGPGPARVQETRRPGAGAAVGRDLDPRLHDDRMDHRAVAQEPAQPGRAHPHQHRSDRLAAESARRKRIDPRYRRARRAAARPVGGRHYRGQCLWFRLSARADQPASGISGRDGGQDHFASRRDRA